eukprot:TRINITY_DN9838_c0_g1_i1.p1 TRINITY_DN9838_c0_g1~~TRINITY_DN9838_c0_g1_i1.p1  ORF type:complete len:106 (+),score=6.43 TRINITY_DN9838_c0_g1_i1:125-442(+)
MDVEEEPQTRWCKHVRIMAYEPQSSRRKSKPKLCSNSVYGKLSRWPSNWLQKFGEDHPRDRYVKKVAVDMRKPLILPPLSSKKEADLQVTSTSACSNALKNEDRA